MGDGDQHEAKRQPAGRPSSSDLKYEKAMKMLTKPGVLRFKIQSGAFPAEVGLVGGSPRTTGLP